MGFLVLGQNNLKAFSRESPDKTHRLASNFTGCLFYLEKSMHPTTSRQKARKLWKSLYCHNMPREIIVHHKDENPFNNELNNLTIMMNGEHTSLHLKGKTKTIKRGNEKAFRRLESLLIILNDH